MAIAAVKEKLLNPELKIPFLPRGNLTGNITLNLGTAWKYLRQGVFVIPNKPICNISFSVDFSLRPKSLATAAAVFAAIYAVSKSRQLVFGEGQKG